MDGRGRCDPDASRTFILAYEVGGVLSMVWLAATVALVVGALVPWVAALDKLRSAQPHCP
jgi:hypothetical protein